MKKMLVLMLVLGLTTIAQAVPTWDLTSDASKVYLSVTSNPGLGIYLGIAVDSAIGTVGAFAKGTEAPSDSASWGTLAYFPDGAGMFNGLGQGEIWAMADLSSPFTYTDGQWLVVNWGLQGSHTSATISAYELFEDGSSSLLDTILVPEPTTIALLGLGGLLMLRRRK